MGSFANLSSPLRDIDEDPQDPGVHIHPGAEGETDDYLYGLRADVGPDGTSGIFYGTVELTDEQREMLLDERIYMDIHTVEFEGGEVRDQLRRAEPEVIAQQ